MRLPVRRETSWPVCLRSRKARVRRIPAGVDAMGPRVPGPGCRGGVTAETRVFGETRMRLRLATQEDAFESRDTSQAGRVRECSGVSDRSRQPVANGYSMKPVADCRRDRNAGWQ